MSAINLPTLLAPALPIEKRSVRANSALTIIDDGSDKVCDRSTTSSCTRSTVSDLTGEEELDLFSPVNWRIRNTFLDSPIVKPTLLQGFQCRRRAWSMPARGREAAERSTAAMAALTPVSDEDNYDFSDYDLPVREEEIVPAVPHQLNGPMPLSLADLVAPHPCSVGSSLHFQGQCKPCAFFWKSVGCKYGTECQFCHLCDADERKRRNKEKRMAMHATQTGGRTPGATNRHARGARGSGHMMM
jgi:hypothetical protein